MKKKIEYDGVRLSDDLVPEILHNISRGPKNHLISDCPLCGKERHFYFNQVSQRWDCKKCSRSGDIVYLLSLLGRLSLIRKFVDITKSLQNRIASVFEESEELIQEPLSPKPVHMPAGFRLVQYDNYLNDRGFCAEDYTKYPVGITQLVNKYDEYIIFPVIEDYNNVGFIGRKKWSRNEFERHEKAHGWAPPRYSNSKTNFQNILYGLDEILFYVDTAILVEGVFTKIACDRRLKIQQDDNFRCLVTFGKRVSHSQILKLLLRGIKNVILIFDEDAVEEAYKHSRELQKYFDSVRIGFVSEGDLDECSDMSFFNCFKNLKESFQFKTEILKKNKLIS